MQLSYPRCSSPAEHPHRAESPRLSDARGAGGDCGQVQPAGGEASPQGLSRRRCKPAGWRGRSSSHALQPCSPVSLFLAYPHPFRPPPPTGHRRQAPGGGPGSDAGRALAAPRQGAPECQQRPSASSTPSLARTPFRESEQRPCVTSTPRHPVISFFFSTTLKSPSALPQSLESPPSQVHEAASDRYCTAFDDPALPKVPPKA